MKTIDAAYLAGMVDADGSISIVKGRGGSQPQVTIANGCHPMLEWCGGIVGVSYSISYKKDDNPNHRDNWDLKWTYNNALLVASIIHPYLRVKAKQAGCLSRWKSVVRRNGKYTKESLEARNELIREIRLLNLRGGQHA